MRTCCCSHTAASLACYLCVLCEMGLRAQICQRETAVVVKFQGCGRGEQNSCAVCDGWGGCMLSCVLCLPFGFHWSVALRLQGRPRLQTFVYHTHTHNMYIHSNIHILDFPSYPRSVWISHKGLVKQVASLTHPTDQPFISVRRVSKGPHTSQKDLLSLVCVLRLWLKFMLLCWRLESFSLQGLQLLKGRI